MGFALRWLPILLALALGAPRCAVAAWGQSVDTYPDSGVAIGLSLAYEAFPRAGFMPCRITIQNGTDRAAAWTFVFSTSAGSYSRQSREVLTRALGAGAGQTATYDVLVPICPSERSGSFFRSPSVVVTGPGVRTPVLTLPNAGRGGGSGYETPFIAMTPALAAPTWKLLKTELEKGRAAALNGSEAPAGLLSEDWRGLAGVAALFISTDEYGALRPAQRAAVRNWVAQGGSLILCGSGEVRDYALATGRDPVACGMGVVRRMPWESGAELNVKDTADLIRGMKDELGDRLRGASPYWKFAEALGPGARNVTFLAMFITVFAAVVGPLNLFVFAGANRRHRLFWTTPLISLVASVLLGVVILLHDGFGGRGVRMALHYLRPSEKQAVVMQEQASRTGLLLSRGFPAGDDLLLAPMNAPSSIDGWQGARTYEDGQQSYGGDWFLSRSVQAQFAEAVVPSREAVELVSPAGAPPEIRSSIAAPLDDFYYVDAQGACWSARNVRAGERVKLAPAPPAVRVKSLLKDAGPMLRHAFEPIAGNKEFFFATSASAACIPTLPSIRWTQDRTVYAGPVTFVP